MVLLKQSMFPFPLSGAFALWCSEECRSKSQESNNTNKRPQAASSNNPGIKLRVCGHILLLLNSNLLSISELVQKFLLFAVYETTWSREAFSSWTSCHWWSCCHSITYCEVLARSIPCFPIFHCQWVCLLQLLILVEPQFMKVTIPNISVEGMKEQADPCLWSSSSS
jgi:hypothetical protein